MTLNDLSSALFEKNGEISVETVKNDETFKKKLMFKDSAEIRSNKDPTASWSLENDIELGYILEYAVCLAIGGELNTLPHTPSDPHTFAYDLIDKDGKRIEVKSFNDRTHGGQFRFNLKSAPEPKPEKAIYLDNIFRYNSYIDYLVGATIRNGYIWFKLVADVKRFGDFVGMKQYGVPKWNNVPSHFYNYSKAQSYGYARYSD